jgi:hypothetical protein
MLTDAASIFSLRMLYSRVHAIVADGRPGCSCIQCRTFITDLGKMGFVWQFITLAGFHCDSLGIDLFAKDYSERGMLAYVEGIQRMERKHKVRAWGAAWCSVSSRVQQSCFSAIVLEDSWACIVLGIWGGSRTTAFGRCGRCSLTPSHLE